MSIDDNIIKWINLNEYETFLENSVIIKIYMSVFQRDYNEGIKFKSNA